MIFRDFSLNKSKSYPSVSYNCVLTHLVLALFFMASCSSVDNRSLPGNNGEAISGHSTFKISPGDDTDYATSSWVCGLYTESIVDGISYGTFIISDGLKSSYPNSSSFSISADRSIIKTINKKHNISNFANSHVLFYVEKAHAEKIFDNKKPATVVKSIQIFDYVESLESRLLIMRIRNMCCCSCRCRILSQ